MAGRPWRHPERRAATDLEGQIRPLWFGASAGSSPVIVAGRGDEVFRWRWVVRAGEIAARLRVSQTAVYEWRRQWRAGGEDALASKGPDGGPGIDAAPLRGAPPSRPPPCSRDDNHRHNYIIAQPLTATVTATRADDADPRRPSDTLRNLHKVFHWNCVSFALTREANRLSRIKQV